MNSKWVGLSFQLLVLLPTGFGTGMGLANPAEEEKKEPIKERPVDTGTMIKDADSFDLDEKNGEKKTQEKLLPPKLQDKLEFVEPTQMTDQDPTRYIIFEENEEEKISPLLTGQHKDDSDEKINVVDLDKLLTTPIESASKTIESLFAAPLSSTVLTRAQIVGSGARTIPEALRLSPGIIVREQSAGNHSVHLRGLDNVPPHSFIFEFNNNTTLVMIDYRVVYSYYMGGTFWETLPIEIDDIERIEIVRGPSSAMYGPNAVSGVINIITRRQANEGLHTRFRFRMEPRANQILSFVSAGFQSGGLRVLASGNFTRMERTQRAYYALAIDEWVDRIEDIPTAFTQSSIDNPHRRYPQPELALEKYAANIFVDYRLSEQIDFHLSAGYQDSLCQKIYVDSFFVLMSTNSSQTAYANFQSNTYGLATQVSFVFGNQLTPMGTLVEVEQKEREAYGYDFYTLDLNLSFEHNLANLRLRPELSYRRAEYDGLLVSDRNAYGNLKPGGKALDNLAASLQTEYTLFDRWRLIAALRWDFYPDRTEENYYIRSSSLPQTIEGKRHYLSYQLASTYQVNPNHILRAVYARAHGSPPLLTTYLNDPTRPPLIRLGNRAIDLLQSDGVEFGYRGNLTKHLDLDFEVFYSHTRNFNSIYLHHEALDQGRVIFQVDNLDVSSSQIGSTFSLALTQEQFQTRIFATIQETRIFDHAPNALRVFDFDHDPRDPANQLDLVHKGTPDLVAGAIANFSLTQDLDLNINCYYTARHLMTRADAALGMMDQAQYQPREYEIRQNLLLNTRISYRLRKNLYLTLTGQNLFNLKNREFPGGDINRAVYMLGIHFDK